MNKYFPVQNKAREDWKASGFKLITLNENAVESDISDNNWFYEQDLTMRLAYGPVYSCFSYFPFCLFNFSNTTVARSNRD